MSRRLPTGAGNFAWLAADKGVRLVVTIVVGFAVARHLKPEGFGALNYALAVAALCMPVAELGLDGIVKRRLIASPETAGSVLATVWRLRFAAAFAIYGLLAVFALCFKAVDGEALVLIAGLLVFQPSMNTADLWLQSTLRAKVSVTAGWVALLVCATGRLWLIKRGAGVVMFAWMAAAEAVLVGVLLLWAGRRDGLPRMEGGRLRELSPKLLKESWPIMLSGIAVALYMKLDMVMLRMLSGEREAGVYAAAVRISELGYFLPVALASSLLPALLKKRTEGAVAYADAMQKFYDLNAAIAYGFATLATFGADMIIGLAYGHDYAAAADVLRWHAWAALFVFLGVARSQYLLNEGRMRFALVSTGLGAVVNFMLNWWWIPSHGATGAAWATLVAYGVAAWGMTWGGRDLRHNAMMQTRALLLPFTGWRYLVRK